jgi:hypothetical protein
MVPGGGLRSERAQTPISSDSERMFGLRKNGENKLVGSPRTVRFKLFLKMTQALARDPLQSLCDEKN